MCAKISLHNVFATTKIATQKTAAARAAGARAADVAAFARRAADRLGVTRRSAGGGGRTRTITIREDDAGDEAAARSCLARAELLGDDDRRA